MIDIQVDTKTTFTFADLEPEQTFLTEVLPGKLLQKLNADLVDSEGDMFNAYSFNDAELVQVSNEAPCEMLSIVVTRKKK